MITIEHEYFDYIIAEYQNEILRVILDKRSTTYNDNMSCVARNFNTGGGH